MGLSCYVIEICGLFDTGLDYNFSSPLTAEVHEKKLSNLFEQLFFMHFCKARRQAGGDVRPKGANPPVRETP